MHKKRFLWLTINTDKVSKIKYNLRHCHHHGPSYMTSIFYILPQLLCLYLCPVFFSVINIFQCLTSQMVISGTLREVVSSVLNTYLEHCIIRNNKFSYSVFTLTSFIRLWFQIFNCHQFLNTYKQKLHVYSFQSDNISLTCMKISHVSKQTTCFTQQVYTAVVRQFLCTVLYMCLLPYCYYYCEERCQTG